MIRTVLTPTSNDLHLHLPKSYIGKEIEVFVYAKDELEEERHPSLKDASRFKGLLNNDEADKYHDYLKKARGEWDRDF